MLVWQSWSVCAGCMWSLWRGVPARTPQGVPVTASCCCSTWSLLHTTGHVRGVHVMLMSGAWSLFGQVTVVAVQYNPMY